MIEILVIHGYAKRCFWLWLQYAANYEGAREFLKVYNEKGEIEITVDGYTFKPDLMFMNQHAVCAYCGQIYMWEKGD